MSPGPYGCPCHCGPCCCPKPSAVNYLPCTCGPCPSAKNVKNDMLECDRGVGTFGGKGCRFHCEHRWPQCNFMNPCIDTRIYRNGEHLSLSYAGHIPGEQYIFGRNLATTTTFAKRRLCQYTPYEFIEPDGCCSCYDSCCTGHCSDTCCPCPESGPRPHSRGHGHDNHRHHHESSSC